MSGRLGELLVRENLISVQQLRKAQEEQQKTGTRIGTALIKVGAIEESKLTDFLSKQYGVPAINLKEFDVEVLLRGEAAGRGTGFSKKEAEQNAARAALERAGLLSSGSK